MTDGAAANDVSLTIDGTPVTVPASTLLVEAAKTIQTDIPVYCYHPKLGPAGLCRICLVEIEKLPKLQIACNTQVQDGMVVHTYGDKVESGRRAVMEFLLLNHPLDCPICDKGGECDLQDFSVAYGQGASRLADPKASKPKALDLGPTIVLDDERCIVCQRCSRFDDIVTRERSLVVKDRGQRDVIATANGKPYRSDFSGNVTELCPVGALTSKTYRFKSRPWDNKRTLTTCTQCSTGCAMFVDERHGTIARTMSVPGDDAISDGWLCDRGRYNVGFYGDPRRLTAPLLRDGDEFTQIGWDEAIERWARALRADVRRAGVLGGARLLNEEILLLAATMRGLGVEDIDWRSGRQRQATPGRYAGTYSQLEHAQLIVAVGRPPSQTAPVLDLRIRKAVSQRGARYATYGLHAAGSFVPWQRLQSLAEIEQLASAVERIAVVWDGVDLELGASLTNVLDRLAARGATLHAYIPGETSNARGADAFGLLPRHCTELDRSGGKGDATVRGRSATEMLQAAERGEVQTLSIFGANPVLQHPLGGKRVAAALRRVPFIAVTELFMTETARLADLILPACAGFEKNGHAYDLAGDVLAVRQAHAPPEGALSDGDMLLALAAELGVEIPDPDEVRARAAAAPSTAVHGFGDARYSDAGSRTQRAATGGAGAGDGGLRVAVGTGIFAGGGTVNFDETLAGLRPRPTATLAPVTAARYGVRTGDLVDVVFADGGDEVVKRFADSGAASRGNSSNEALSALTVRIDAEMPEETVAVLDGLAGAPANGFFDGDAVTLRVRVGSIAQEARAPA